MPRVPTALLRKAYTIDPLLPALLAPCRDLQTARNELRWLREHVGAVAAARRARGGTLAKGAMLKQLVRERASGKPLQYLLGTEYFGDLEIRCRPGVLIPRADTAASVSRLVGLLRNAQKLPPELRVMDLCTGTGCIPLLFQHEFGKARDDIDVRALGVDISNTALALAYHNLKRTRKNEDFAGNGEISFLNADVLMNPFEPLTGGPLALKIAMNYEWLPPFWDIVISNPPYISPQAYWKTTTRSVRGFEPKLALVPPPVSQSKQTDDEQGDVFYPHLLNVAQDFEAKIVLLEVADLEQALRVARLAEKLDLFDGVEIWREQPDANPEEPLQQDGIDIVGTGNGRSVLCWRDVGTTWLNKPVGQPAKQGKEAYWKEFVWPKPSDA
ncbi:S-adenosyl-L-methionine-dependent methyltransferase [Plenodomus tracheiphilus IPT5]|uniref:S-adenosyl-L-methionine-dependent methyltransferase n=1 Tax=Plenodomus tracheiphilus IPT5 TaxID=1408161 RepID=A0A6A7BI27_9PLEO|nr:S-adenosyl-L-methionine-dependent methyltransferase [Plenodomus tracheiphilus IPT5]